MIISLAAPWFGRQVLSWVVDMASIGAAIGYAYTCGATLITIKQFKEKGKLWLKTTSILGLIFSCIFVLMLVVPGMPSYLAFESRIALVVWIILGIVFYRRRQR